LPDQFVPLASQIVVFRNFSMQNQTQGIPLIR
jgi:hypothetical protein